MTRNPIESLMQRSATRREAGIIGGLIATSFLGDTERPEPPQFEREWTDEEGNKHFAMLLQPGQAAVFTTQGALQAFGNVYRNPEGPTTLLAMGNREDADLEVVIPGGQSVDTSLLVSAGNTYEERVDDVFKFIQEEHARLQAESARAEKPMKPLAVIGAIAIGRTVEGQVIWNRILQQAIDPEGNLSSIPNVPEARSGTLPKKALPTPVAPKEAPPPPAEEVQLPFSAPRPKSLEEPDMGSAVLGNHVQKAWFHGVTVPRLFNAENGWRGAMTWAVSILDGSDNATLAPGGDEKNPKIVVVPSGQTEAVVRLGVMTTEQYKGRRLMDDLQRSTRTGQLHPAAMWIKTQPGVRIRLFDPESGKPLIDQNGKDLIIVTNQNGDAGILLANTGLFVAVLKIPKGSQVEHVVTFGPHDQPGDVNLIDARSAKVKT